MAAGEIGCCVFLRRPSSRGYRHLTSSGSDDGDFPATEAAAVRVVAGRREKREFLVDPFVLQREPFRELMEIVTSREKKGRRVGDGDAIFVDVDAIFFEHMLWSFYNDFSSDSPSSPLFRLNLREIIEFYSQDF
ncbi:uncharacterized protein LOC110112397 [Dendrobium catenatum]|uniref:uncharacterized protein LOC110112397 n=1 Tax=Dendrobium catenatum TaxID=906689 RepID=UPI0009F28DD9|nr:uncharacterized protein LOC110112397 [Dendrobium catenatum]